MVLSVVLVFNMVKIVTILSEIACSLCTLASRPVPYVGRLCCWFLSLLRGFFSGFSGFPPSTKTNISKFQFDQDREPARKPAKTDVASSLNIVLYHSLYLFYQKATSFQISWFIPCSCRAFKDCSLVI